MKKLNKKIIYKSLLYGSLLGGIIMWLISSSYNTIVVPSLSFLDSFLEVKGEKVVMTSYWVVANFFIVYFSFKKMEKKNKQN